MTNQEAAAILRKHIDTYQYQLSDEGWNWMVRHGIAADMVQERMLFKRDADRQIEAYQIAINALLGS